MADINDEYERRLRRHIANTSRRIQQSYLSSINEISNQVEKIKWNGQVFSINQFPQLQRKIDSVIKNMHTAVYSNIVNSVKASWDLSNKKNDILVDRRIAERQPNKRVKQILYDPNKEALDAFLARKEKGLNLSSRVWNTLEPFKSQLEAGLGVAIANGKSAIETAKDLQKYLLNADALVRKVRDSQGKLTLSAKSKASHPGRGIYRSSYKNALRLTRTENNIAYRTADYERWNNMPFVVGFEVKTSGSHPRYDICDRLKGIYPKDFKFSGWHPQCLCYQVPKMISEDEYSKLEDAILAGKDLEVTDVEQITRPPDSFDSWVQENKDRVAIWKNTPYWVEDNREYFDNALNGKIPKPKKTLNPGGKAVAPQFTQIDGSIKKKVNQALQLIDSVHGDGDLMDIPIKKMYTENIQAVFNLNTSGDPVDMRVSTKATHPQFSVVHEMGHYFDLYSIGEKGVFDSHDSSSVIGKVLKVAKESDLITRLNAIYIDGALILDDVEYPLSSNGLKYVRYLLEPDEIWARAYSQYIAKKTDHALLIDALNTRVERGAETGLPTQWEDADFLEIEKAIDEMLLELGWVR